MSAVVIGASNLLAPLCEHLAGEGELLTFADTEPIQALQTILERRPELIVLERLFAATPRGAALINRIKTDPHLANAQVRVMSHTGDYTRQIARSVVGAPSLAGPVETTAVQFAQDATIVTTTSPEGARPLDWHGTRRAARHRVRAGVEIQLDGNPVSVVDLSSVGAQVMSGTILRPNQKVRVIIPEDESIVRCRGTIAWAKFELPKANANPIYRAGIEFLDADKEFVERFVEKLKAER